MLQDLKDGVGEDVSEDALAALRALEAKMDAVMADVRERTTFYASVHDGFAEEVASRAHKERTQTQLAEHLAASKEDEVKRLNVENQRLLRECAALRHEQEVKDTSIAELQGKLEAAEARVVSQTEEVRRLAAEAAVKRPTEFDAAVESRDVQLRALERAVIEECKDKEALTAQLDALAGERTATQNALRNILMDHDLHDDAGDEAGDWRSCLCALLPGSFWDAVPPPQHSIALQAGSSAPSPTARARSPRIGSPSTRCVRAWSACGRVQTCVRALG